MIKTYELEVVAQYGRGTGCWKQWCSLGLVTVKAKSDQEALEKASKLSFLNEQGLWSTGGKGSSFNRNFQGIGIQYWDEWYEEKVA